MRTLRRRTVARSSGGSGRFWVAVAALAMAAGVPTIARPVLGQGSITIVTGKVVDKGSQVPLPAVNITDVLTGNQTTTRQDGTYRLAGVRSGQAQLRALRIGYQGVTEKVAIPDSGVVTVDFALSPTNVTLDQVVVTATGETQRERQNGSTVATISADSINKAAVSTFSDLVTAKAAGVQVEQSSGTVGTGARLRVRGSNSVSLDNDPLLVIDGVFVDNNPQSFPSGQNLTGGQAPSRFDDLNPADIENVEVLKGPAASALYGTAGANGVLLVTTKKGVAGRARWTAHADWGSIGNVSKFPANYGQVGIAGGARTTGCTLVAQALGQCTKVADSLLSWNPLESIYSPFSHGNHRYLFGGSVAGGSDVTRYYVSGDFDDTHGIYPNNFQTKNNGRANLQATPSSSVDFALNAGYLQSRLQLPQNDNNTYSPIASAVLGFPINDPTNHGYAFLLPAVSNNLIARQDVDRFTGGANGTWRPFTWLSLNAIAGIDFTNRADHQLYPTNVIPPAAGGIQSSGLATSNPFQLWTYTTQVNGSATYNLSAGLRSTTSAGTQYTNHQVRGTEAQGVGLAAGTGSVAGATNQFSAFEVNQQIVNVGYYGQEQFAWRDKMFLTGALRADDNSAFGQKFKLAYYPSVSASWVIGEEPWFPTGAVLSSLRLRGAFGYSGQHPAFQEAQTFFTTVAYRDVGGEVGAVSIGGIGNANLKPERSGEVEGGFDAGLWRDRINLQVTGYSKTTTDALVSVNLAPSLGGITQGLLAGTSSQFVNLGKVTNRGIEVVVTGTLIDTRSTRLDLTVNDAFNKNKLVTLGPGIAPIRFGLSSISGEFIQRQESGYPLGGFWQQAYTYADANKDGIIVPSEVTLAPTETFRGNPFPETQLSLSPSLTVFRYFRVSTLFDHRGTSFTYNSTSQFRCSLVFPFTNCQAAFDPRTPLAAQAAVAADALGSDAGFLESTAFWKWRELSVTVSAPQDIASTLRLHSLAFTVAGRNLKTWTKYTGPDPETNFTGQARFDQTDFFTQPILQYWTGRFDLTF